MNEASTPFDAFGGQVHVRVAAYLAEGGATVAVGVEEGVAGQTPGEWGPQGEVLGGLRGQRFAAAVDGATCWRTRTRVVQQLLDLKVLQVNDGVAELAEGGLGDGGEDEG
ncbi:hypothetical protein [Streptomyces erythrochromogenes]|uniref:hypothetical protein n=1 Tax=Streptomyces erythrochromogenes TaxID=285574 RepID=UPI0037D4BA4C